MFNVYVTIAFKWLFSLYSNEMMGSSCLDNPDILNNGSKIGRLLQQGQMHLSKKSKRNEYRMTRYMSSLTLERALDDLMAHKLDEQYNAKREYNLIASGP